MAAVTVREMPARTLDALKMRASVNHRSLNGEILCIFEHCYPIDRRPRLFRALFRPSKLRYAPKRTQIWEALPKQ